MDLLRRKSVVQGLGCRPESNGRWSRTPWNHDSTIKYHRINLWHEHKLKCDMHEEALAFSAEFPQHCVLLVPPSAISCSGAVFLFAARLLLTEKWVTFIITFFGNWIWRFNKCYEKTKWLLKLLDAHSREEGEVLFLGDGKKRPIH